MSDTLLEVIARLQQPGVLSLAEGRRLLLDYARKRARARLGLLFLLDLTGQQLLLAERCGTAPALPPAQDVTAALPVNGLFATALRQQGLVYYSQRESDAQALPFESALIWPGGRVLLCAVGLNATSDEALHEHGDHSMSQGIIALCADARGSAAPLSKQAEQDILLCAALLGNYLDAQDGHRPDSQRPLTQAMDVHKGQSTWRSGVAHPRRGMLVGERAIDTLAAIYEIGLAWDVDSASDERALCQRVLDVLRDGLQAAGGSLWLYTPTRERFTWRASSGNASGVAGVIEDELAETASGLHRDTPDKRVALRGTRVITWSPGRAVVLHLLEAEGLTQDATNTIATDEVVGAVAFVIEGEQDISEELRLWLAYACRAAALVIRSWQHRSAERQAAIDAEHSRIARDIHDGAAQQIAQVIHMLEYIGHIAEQQPVTARQEAGRARATLTDSLNNLRRSIATLFPERLEQVSLDEAVGELLDEFRRNNPSIKAHYEHYGAVPARRWLASLEVPIYRLVQEALQNVQQHASALCVTVQLRAVPGMLVVQVSDDGSGFEIGQARRHQADKPAHFGLRSMQERVEQAGGTFTLTSKPGAGTTIKASFPLPARAMTLTGREHEVLRLLVEGASNRVIADRLSVSIETVKSHMHHIMQKLGVKDRTQAAVLAARQQWV